MMKKSILIVFVFFLLKVNGFALTFVPDVYINLGAVSSKTNSSFSRSGLKDTEGIITAIGIRPIDLPILGGFRGELQYSTNFNSGNNGYNVYGAVLYYDILRIIPIVHPYVGIGYYGSSIKAINGVNNLSSVNAGINASIPVIGLDLFLEYRQMNNSFGDFFKRIVGSNNRGIVKKDIMFGFRYYFLK